VREGAGGADLGATPLTFERPRGATAVLRFALPDFVEVERAVRFDADHDETVVLEPAAAPAHAPASRRAQDGRPEPYAL
jgi:hypothetical protein